MKTLLKYENAKLRKQFIFNLPATNAVCGRVCPGCYAAKAQVRFPKTVLSSRENLLAASKQSNFVRHVVKELSKTRRTVKAVRIHESGEFYSQKYVNKWNSIALALPHITFYAFTKRLNDFDFSKIKELSNVIIINSLSYNKINYGTIDYLKSHPCKNICPATVKDSKDTTVCGVTCDFCMTKQAQEEGVVFVAH